MCTAGGQCSQVTGSATAKPALDALQKAANKAQGSLTTKLNLGLAFAAAIRSLRADLAAVSVALVAYESAVNGVASGDAAVITAAGCQARDTKPAQVPLGQVSVVHTKPGKHSMEAILSWPKGPGARGYAIEVSYTPQSPQGPWTALNSGTRRRRTVKGPTPGAQMLARVASLGSDGTQSEWSDVVLVTCAY
jgi:hypothetical protein